MRAHLRMFGIAAAVALIAMTAAADGPIIAVDGAGSFRTASFAFFASVDADGVASGHFVYVNHDTGLHVTGAITDFESIGVRCGQGRTLREGRIEIGGDANSADGPVSFAFEIIQEAGVPAHISLELAGAVSDSVRGELESGAIRCSVT